MITIKYVCYDCKLHWEVKDKDLEKKYPPCPNGCSAQSIAYDFKKEPDMIWVYDEMPEQEVPLILFGENIEEGIDFSTFGWYHVDFSGNGSFFYMNIENGIIENSSYRNVKFNYYQYAPSGPKIRF